MKSDKGLLHDFKLDNAERRQYPRLAITFPFWWLQDGRVDRPVAGIGIEISAGGLQFLLELQHVAPPECNIAFEIQGRSIRANVRVIRSDEQTYKDRLWHRHGAQFVGLLATDFDFLMALRLPGVLRHAQGASALSDPRSSATGAGSRPAGSPGATPARSGSKPSIGNLESYSMLPASIKAGIVAKLTALKRIDPVTDPNLARMAAHYGGIQPAAAGDPPYHRFSFRSKRETNEGVKVFDTQFLVSDDGTQILLFE